MTMTLSGKLLIDTNILIYATMGSDPRHGISKEVLDLRRSSGNQLFVSVQNLSEIYPNSTGPKAQPPDSPGLARKKITSLSGLPGVKVLPITLETVFLALEIAERYGVTRQRYFDMQLVASMVLEEIPTLVTENVNDFEGIVEIRCVNPFLD